MIGLVQPLAVSREGLEKREEDWSKNSTAAGHRRNAKARRDEKREPLTPLEGRQVRTLNTPNDEQDGGRRLEGRTEETQRSTSIQKIPENEAGKTEKTRQKKKAGEPREKPTVHDSSTR